MSSESDLRSLTRNEASVLYWKCQGLKYEHIGGRLGYSTDWVQLNMSNVYQKLGFDKDMHWTRRVEILEQVFCPKLTEILENNPSNLKHWPLDWGEPIVVPETYPLVLYDEMRQEESQKEKDREPPVIVIPSQPLLGRSTTRRSGLQLFLLFVVLCLMVLSFSVGRLGFFASRTTPTLEAQTSEPNTPLPSVTRPSTLAPTDTAQPSQTSIPTVPPTAVPLPISENFNSQYSPLWRVIGDPILTTGQAYYYGYDGVFTTRQGGTASIAIGNTAWTNYTVSFSGDETALSGSKLELSVRVIDLNNRVVLSCSFSNCSWIVIHKGITDVLDDQQRMVTQYRLILTAQGNTFSVFGDGGNFQDENIQLILPPKYENEFLVGGVMLEIKDMEIDYIEIQPFP